MFPPLLTLALIQDRIMNPSNAFVLHRLVGPGYWNMLVFGAIKTLNVKRRCKVFAYSRYIFLLFSFFPLLIIFCPLFKNRTWTSFFHELIALLIIKRTRPINLSKGRKLKWKTSKIPKNHHSPLRFPSSFLSNISLKWQSLLFLRAINNRCLTRCPSVIRFRSIHPRIRR